MCDYKKSLKFDLAIKEIELLNVAIARQETIGLKIRGWFLTLISAVTITLLSKDSFGLSLIGYFAISVTIILFFFFIEISHRVVEFKAIDRSQHVERLIRENKVKKYDGPKISDSLVEKNPKCWFEAIFHPRIFPSYLIIFILILLIFLFYE